MGEIEKSNSKLDASLDYHGLDVREYQIKIAHECATKNSLVVLPTGLGKTIIAVLVTNQILKTFPPNSKIIVLAPSIPLVNQHYQTFLKFLNISEEKFAILTGKILPENRIGLSMKVKSYFSPPKL